MCDALMYIAFTRAIGEFFCCKYRLPYVTLYFIEIQYIQLYVPFRNGTLSKALWKWRYLGRTYHTLEAQCWPKETLRVLFYEAKVPNLDGYGKVWKCSQAIGLLRHWYYTPPLSNEVYNIVLAQGDWKLSAKVER